jgi:hypothetical protein
LADPEAAEQMPAKHARYFAVFLDQYLDNLLGGGQMEAIVEIELAHKDVRLAHKDVRLLTLESARKYLAKALERGDGHEGDFPEILQYIIVIAADMIMLRGEHSLALRWLAAAISQPNLWAIYCQYATQLLDQWQLQIDPTAWETPVQEAESLPPGGGFS